MVASIQISDEDVRELQDLTRQSDVSEAILFAMKEYVRYTRRMQLKELTGRVEMVDNWQDLERAELEARCENGTPGAD